MRILFDVVHPAQVHFLRPLWTELRRRGHELHVTSRAKDCTVELLDVYAIPHRPLTLAARTRAGLVGEMLERDWHLIREMRAFRPHVVVGKEAACAHQAAWWLGIPSVAIDDTDDALWQRRLSLPFATRVVGDPRARPRRGTYTAVPGLSALGYLHPGRFRPDPDVRRRLGLGSGPLILLRLVDWRANHDGGHRGLDRRAMDRWVEGLRAHGTVVLSSESPRKEGWAKGCTQVPAGDLLQVLAQCALQVGESATLAAEGALLGVPVLYASTRRLWYTDLLEERGLLHNVHGVESGLDLARRCLGRSPQQWAALRDEYLNEVGDPLPRWVEAIETVTRTGGSSLQNALK